MSKGNSADNDTPFSPPPRYRTPAVNAGMEPQRTGRSQFEHELDDLRHGRTRRPENYADPDPYYRWRRGVENDMPYRPPRKTKTAHIFATCCCGSVWGVVAWIAVIVILMAGSTALVVKAVMPTTHEAVSTPTPASSVSVVTVTTSSTGPTTITSTVTAPITSSSSFSTSSTPSTTTTSSSSSSSISSSTSSSETDADTSSASSTTKTSSRGTSDE